MNIKEIKTLLKKEGDKKYKKFSSSLIPNCPNMLGVRLPVLRKIAKEIAKGDFEEFLKTEPEFFEEKMLQGMIIGQIKKPVLEILKYVEFFVPKIDNWSICDSFVVGLKFTKKNKEIVFDFIYKYLNSKKEFERRFLLVMLLAFYVEEKYLDKIFDILNSINLDGYYAKMGAAWLISVCFVKFPNETKEFLSKTKIDKETLNKGVRKIIESYRVGVEDKNFLREKYAR